MKKVHIKSYGCQMNVYDSQRMGDLLVPLGYEAASGPEDADLIILNTCHIREKAAEKVYSELGKLRHLKESRSRAGEAPVIAVAGCVAQAEGEEIVRRAKGVDLVFGPQTYHRLPELLKSRAETGRPVIETEFPAEDKFDHLARTKVKRGVTAFLTVQEGCDKFCTFCVVPYTRGSEFSRPVAQIEAEARALVEAGVREITLLGQNVNAYHGAGLDGETWSLARLITHLSRIDGIERLRFTTSHPRDMSDDLIAAHAENPKLMPYLHLPIQAGSDRILKEMNRGHRSEDYLKLIARIRQARPDIALSGDFIVGFPGETEADFAATLAIVREVFYAGAFSFKYSPRPGTPAAAMAGQVPEEVKSDRLARLQHLLGTQQKAFNEACKGRNMPILLEKPGRHDGQLIGRSPYLQSVYIDAGTHAIGDMVNVTIDAVGSNSLSAHIHP
ncbi:tRNA (N6-isopentenyl adenosine(37)-C2)-methylthiotransferase MiaB [Taklimakanibacter lacteus]|uniref:tRNA (N6-isopentenyl adenosine(37)-C2)-methylthiotransferase MiaB n=1 Tax=Taklimakanibacter lacteus TaxID=2268456 RepID=UPI0034D57314